MNPDGGSDTNNSKGKIGTNTILESNVARTSSSSSNESRQRLMESGETTFDGREEKHKNIDSIDVLEEKEVMYCSLETEDDGRIATKSVANKNENAIVEVTHGNGQRRFDSDSETSKVSVAHDGRVSWSKSPDQRSRNSNSDMTGEFMKYFKPIKVSSSSTKSTHLTCNSPQGFLPSKPLFEKFGSGRLKSKTQHGNVTYQNTTENGTEIALTSKGFSVSEVPFTETSVSESASSVHTTSSSYFTESDSTIGNSVSLPSLASSFSELETYVDSGSSVSEAISSERATSAEDSISDEHHDIQLQVKDSVNLAHQRIGPRIRRNDILNSTSNAIQRGFRNAIDTNSSKSSLSSNLEYTRGSVSETASSEESSSTEIGIISRRTVSFLPASCSEVLRQPEKKDPVTRRHRIKEKKSAPLFSTPMQVAYNKRSDIINKDFGPLDVTPLRKTLTTASLSGDSSQVTTILPSDSSLKSKSFSSVQSSEATSLSSRSPASFMSSPSEVTRRQCEDSSSSSSGFRSLGLSISERKFWNTDFRFGQRRRRISAFIW